MIADIKDLHEKCAALNERANICAGRTLELIERCEENEKINDARGVRLDEVVEKVRHLWSERVEPLERAVGELQTRMRATFGTGALPQERQSAPILPPGARLPRGVFVAANVFVVYRVDRTDAYFAGCFEDKSKAADLALRLGALWSVADCAVLQNESD